MRFSFVVGVELDALDDRGGQCWPAADGFPPLAVTISCYDPTMATAKQIPTMPADVFGDLTDAGPFGPWHVQEHSEMLIMSDGTSLLYLRTSEFQTDDGLRGTWITSIVRAGEHVPCAQGHIPWCSPTEARQKAIEWAASIAGQESR